MKDLDEGPNAIRSCQICGNLEGNRILQAQEMMYGLGEIFPYLECGACGTLQILAIPEDLARYYPSDYYSYQVPRMNQNSVRTFLRSHRARFYLGMPTLVGRLAAHKESRRPSFFRFLKAARATLDTPILDVGCGGGELLSQMAKYGFRDLTGIDPFMSGDTDYSPCFRVRKRGLEEESGRYPLVMMNHSFEHMAEPLKVLQTAKKLLTEGGTLLVRIPVAGTFAHRLYGMDWRGVEPPRHFFVYTERALRLLAAKAGWKVGSVYYDSDSAQFWVSEQYRRGIPITAPNSYLVDKEGSSFSPADMVEFAREAARLNQAGDGDTACFFLEPES